MSDWNLPPEEIAVPIVLTDERIEWFAWKRQLFLWHVPIPTGALWW